MLRRRCRKCVSCATATNIAALQGQLAELPPVVDGPHIRPAVPVSPQPRRADSALWRTRRGQELRRRSRRRVRELLSRLPAGGGDGDRGRARHRTTGGWRRDPSLPAQGFEREHARARTPSPPPASAVTCPAAMAAPRVTVFVAPYESEEFVFVKEMVVVGVDSGGTWQTADVPNPVQLATKQRTKQRARQRAKHRAKAAAEAMARAAERAAKDAELARNDDYLATLGITVCVGI